MKRKVLLGILVFEALLCLALRLLQASFAEVFSAAAAFPFEQIGLGLRLLSLSGAAGNVLALALYAILCLAPLAVLALLRKKRGLQAEDWLLALLSAVLFTTLYLMINPGYIGALTHVATGLSMGKAALGLTVYSVLSGYLLLKLLRLFSSGGTEQLIRYMSALLCLLNVLFTYIIFSACVGGLLDSLTTLRTGNSGNEQLLGPSYIFLALQFIVDALPYALDMLVVFAALRLLMQMRLDRYSEQTVAATRRMARLCVAALSVTVLTNIGFNLLQLLAAKSLLILNSTLQIPLFSIIFVLAALLLLRFVSENKQLKDDNDMFI